MNESVKRLIHSRLIERGSNFTKFSRLRGYKARTVTQVVDRWAGAPGEPRGRLTYRILKDLGDYVGLTLTP